MASAYAELKDYDIAYDILEQGYEKTGSRQLRNALDSAQPIRVYITE